MTRIEKLIARSSKRRVQVRGLDLEVPWIVMVAALYQGSGRWLS